MNKYQWPATAIGSEEMALLHSVRETSEPRTPITQLIARAIRAAYSDAATAITETPTLTNPGSTALP